MSHVRFFIPPLSWSLVLAVPGAGRCFHLALDDASFDHLAKAFFVDADAAPGSLATDPILSSTTLDGLYRAHQPWLLGWLKRRLGCPHRAEDLAQDTFERIISRRDDVFFGEIRALLTTIAKGLVVDHRRRAALERAYLDALAALPEPTAPSPEARLLILEALVELDHLLDGLPERVRQAFLLSQLDGQSYPQIAALLGVSVSSVQQYMTRAFRVCYAARHSSGHTPAE